MSGETVTMSYTLDGEDLGVAFTVPKSELNEEPLFPHILTKNCSFSCNLGQDDPWFPPSDNSYVLIGKLADSKELVQGVKRPAAKEECEVIMMVGLPASGKSFWVSKYDLEHKDKRYTILGTNNLIDKMKVCN
jgi:heterogeneous nuclear ribonucleoprotein U-like protein 1